VKATVPPLPRHVTLARSPDSVPSQLQPPASIVPSGAAPPWTALNHALATVCATPQSLPRRLRMKPPTAFGQPAGAPPDGCVVVAPPEACVEVVGVVLGAGVVAGVVVVVPVLVAVVGTVVAGAVDPLEIGGAVNAAPAGC
jgi:hypothetical protein